jgi:hypothetical protein
MECDAEYHETLHRPNAVPCRCGQAGCGCSITRTGWFADSELGTHNLRFVLDEPGWPVRLDMDGSWVPLGVNPAPPEDLPNGFMPAESDNCAEDTVYSTRAVDDLVTGLGLDSAQLWLDRVLVRLDPDQGAWAPVCSAYTVVPFAVVAGHDLT